MKRRPSRHVSLYSQAGRMEARPQLKNLFRKLSSSAVGIRIGSGRVGAAIGCHRLPEWLTATRHSCSLGDSPHISALLPASELSASRAVSRPAERSVRDHVYDHIKQRCSDASLQAADVAGALSISKRTLHRALALCGETFGETLIQARVDLAVRMLQSPLFDRVTTAEIGRRAGFSDASHFVKVLRRRTGQTPFQMRRARPSHHGRRHDIEPASSKPNQQ